MEAKATQALLNELVETLKDGQKGYADAMTDVEDSQLKETFKKYSVQRAGYITEREARRLHRRERDIARHEAGFKSDGVVTPQERRQLRNEVTALRGEVERMMRNERRGRG